MIDHSQVPRSARHKAPQFQFVQSVRVKEAPASIRMSWRKAVLLAFWVMIAVKCFLAHWAIVHWEMPVGSVYVWAPTVLAALLCSIVFVASGKVTGSEQ